MGVIFRITPASNVSFYPHDILAGLIFMVVLLEFAATRKKIKEKKLFVMISLFLLIGFISLAINSGYLSVQAFLTSFAYLVRYASYVSIIFAFQFLDKKFKDSLNVKLITAGTIFVLLGYVQYFFYPNLRNLYYLGWDEHLYRFFSTFLDPNFAGAFLVLILILLSENIIPRIRNRNRKLFILAFIWGITLAAIFLTYSRSAALMLLIAASVFLVIHKVYKAILLVLVALIISFFIFPNPNLQGLSPIRIASTEARIGSARGAIKIISKNPIIGVGFNAYRYAQIRYGLVDEKATLISNAGAGTDNSYLFILATSGILGFVVFVLFWVNIIKVIVETIRTEFYARIALASIAAILLNTLFINSIFYPPIMAWIFMLIGITVNRKQ